MQGFARTCHDPSRFQLSAGACSPLFLPRRLPLWTFRDRLLPSGDTEVTVAAMVQAQSLRGYRELVGDLGGNPTRLLRQSGIDAGRPQPTHRLHQLRGTDRSVGMFCGGTSLSRLRTASRRTTGHRHPRDAGGGHAIFRHDGRSDAVRVQISRGLQRWHRLHHQDWGIPCPSPAGVQAAFGALPPMGTNRRARHRLTWRIMTLLSEGRCQLQQVCFPARSGGNRGHAPRPLQRPPRLPC